MPRERQPLAQGRISLPASAGPSARNAGCSCVAVSYGAHSVAGLQEWSPLYVAHSVRDLGQWLRTEVHSPLQPS